MKHIVKLQPHQYLQVDTYRRRRKNLLLNTATLLLVTCMTAVTISAAFGIDLTNLNPNSNAHNRQQCNHD